jgi:CheY-like chemotaxis protein
MKRVLVIDDDPLVRSTLGILLRAQGFDVVLSHDGRDGIEAAEASAFDLAIVDILMPGLDGLEAIKTLSRLTPKLPIVAMSGRMLDRSSAHCDEFRIRATKLGAAHCLPKPFTAQDVKAAVEACLGESADACP